MSDANLAISVHDELGASRAAKRAALGRHLFFDTNLSEPPGESCATCHSASHAFTDTRTANPTSSGALPTLFGNRNTPSAAYAMFSPPLHFDAAAGTFLGGQFWDGRAASLEEQAKGPFLNPLEMRNGSKADVVAKVRRSHYASLFHSVFGHASLEDPTTAFDRIAEAIASFERSGAFHRFSSKFDAFTRHRATLTASEERGLALFRDPKKGNCNACHPSDASPDGTPALFTDFSYDNIGVPKNPRNPFYGLPPSVVPDAAHFVDHGLATTLNDASLDGKMKVPTLRNVAVTAPYMHNGYFERLRDVVDFYNTRDVRTWPAAEVPATVNLTELGHQGLSAQEVDDIVAFLGTLTDGYEGAED